MSSRLARETIGPIQHVDGPGSRCARRDDKYQADITSPLVAAARWHPRLDGFPASRPTRQRRAWSFRARSVGDRQLHSVPSGSISITAREALFWLGPELRHLSTMRFGRSASISPASAATVSNTIFQDAPGFPHDSIGPHQYAFWNSGWVSASQTFHAADIIDVDVAAALLYSLQVALGQKTSRPIRTYRSSDRRLVEGTGLMVGFNASASQRQGSHPQKKECLVTYSATSSSVHPMSVRSCNAADPATDGDFHPQVPEKLRPCSPVQPFGTCKSCHATR